MNNIELKTDDQNELMKTYYDFTHKKLRNDLEFLHQKYYSIYLEIIREYIKLDSFELDVLSLKVNGDNIFKEESKMMYPIDIVHYKEYKELSSHVKKLKDSIKKELRFFKKNFDLEFNRLIRDQYKIIEIHRESRQYKFQTVYPYII